MRDEYPDADGHPRANGRPHPAANGRPVPSLNGVPSLRGAFTRVLPGGDPDVDGPLDLVAVQADDELIGVLGARPAGGGRPDADVSCGDDRLAALLAAWRAEIDAEPLPELVDLDDAVAAVLAGVRAHEQAHPPTRSRAVRRPSGRLRHLAPLAAAAAIIVATVTGVGLGSQDAMPGDTLWAVQKVVNPERAESIEAKVTVEEHLQQVRTALRKGDTVAAAQALEAIRAEIKAVRGEEGQSLLEQEQVFLTAKFADARPGAPVDLSTPPVSNPAARPTGAPGAPPAPAPPPAAPSVPASGSVPPGPPPSGEPPAGSPSAPAPGEPGKPAGGEPGAPVPAPNPPAPVPPAPGPDPAAPKPADPPAPGPNPPAPPGNGEGVPDAPVPGPVPPSPAVPAGDPAVPPPTGATTASGSASAVATDTVTT